MKYTIPYCVLLKPSEQPFSPTRGRRALEQPFSGPALHLPQVIHLLLSLSVMHGCQPRWETGHSQLLVIEKHSQTLLSGENVLGKV